MVWCRHCHTFVPETKMSFHMSTSIVFVPKFILARRILSLKKIRVGLSVRYHARMKAVGAKLKIYGAANSNIKKLHLCWSKILTRPPFKLARTAFHLSDIHLIFAVAVIKINDTFGGSGIGAVDLSPIAIIM
ncbi:hypothetical protein BpHYR1_023812 [Brachionus plicatilis]|uniref:Uncharacterized protein n=1 Tax=Brachionus plicatilis TaxID=10195 RepID=A0A3M7R045_BRAPC|nr:hypothetical protein BpHYR1_023812 [Brachionus plicatilis]